MADRADDVRALLAGEDAPYAEGHGRFKIIV
jgi:hypothetical protein